MYLSVYQKTHETIYSSKLIEGVPSDVGVSAYNLALFDYEFME